MISIDAKSIRDAERQIKALGSAVAKAQYRAVNQAAKKARTASSKAITDQVRLKSSYVKARLTITKNATASNPEAILTGRGRATRLATYGAKQRTRSAPNAKGDALRGIAAGRKQAGISVAVNRGSPRKLMPGAFLMPLRIGQEKSNSGMNGLGLFIRTGPGKEDIEHKYGPSINQLLNDIFPDLTPSISDDLNKQYQRQLDYELSKVGK